MPSSDLGSGFYFVLRTPVGVAGISSRFSVINGSHTLLNVGVSVHGAVGCRIDTSSWIH